MSQADFAKWNERHAHRGWEAARRDREVWAREAGRGANRGQQVLHQGEVQHLLLGDLHQGVVPTLDQRHLLGREPFSLALLEGEGGEEVLAQDQVLELGGLTEGVDQRLTVLQDQRRLGIGGLAGAGLQDVRQAPVPIRA